MKNPARLKVEQEGACRVCGHGDVEHLDAAHLIPRGVAPGQGFAMPAQVVPLCSAAKGGPGCHEEYDSHRLDLLGHLTPEEEAEAVRNARGLENARRYLCPSDYRGEVAVARRAGELRVFDTAPRSGPLGGRR